MQATAVKRPATIRHFRFVHLLVVLAITLSLIFLGGCQQQGPDGEGGNAPTKLSAEDQKKAKAHFLNAESYLSQGQLRPAMMEARNTLYADPNHVEAAHLIAQMLVKTGDGYGANKQIDILLFNDEDNVDYQLLQVEAMLLQNRYRTALSLLEKFGLPENKADKIKYYLLQAEAHSGSGQLDDAIDSANEVLKLDSDNASALVWIAKAHFERDNGKDAVKYTELALNTGRDNLELWLWQGKLATLKEDFAAAEEAYSRALTHVQKLDILTADKYLALNLSLIHISEPTRPY